MLHNQYSVNVTLTMKKGVCQASGNNKPDTLPLFTVAQAPMFTSYRGICFHILARLSHITFSQLSSQIPADCRSRISTM